MAVAFRASATSTGASITIPVTAQAGDLAFLMQQSSDPSSVTEVIPSGWTANGSLNTGSAGTPATRWTGCWKILESGDPGASVTGADGGTADAKIMVVFSGANGLSAVTPADVEGVAGGPDPASQTITAGSGAVPLVVIGIAGVNDAAATFSTASPSFDAQLTAGNLRVGYKVYTSSPADHTIDKGDEGQRNFLGGLYFEVKETQRLTPSLYTSAGAFYGPTVGLAAQPLTPGLFTNSQSFFAPAVTTSRALSPGLFTATGAFYAPTVGRGAVNLAAALLSASATFYAATVSRGTVGLVAPLYTSSGAFYAPTIGRGAVGLAPGRATYASAFYGPTIGGLYSVVVGRAQNDATFFAPTASPGAAGLAPGRFDQAGAFYGPVVGSGLAAALVENEASFYAATISPGGVSLAPDRFDGDAIFYDGAVSTGGALLPALFTDGDAFYGPTVAAGAIALSADWFDDEDTFYGPAIGLPPYILATDLLAGEAVFYAATVASVAVQDIAPALFVDADVFYGAFVGQGTDTPIIRRLVLGSRRRDVPAEGPSRIVVLGSADRGIVARPD
jgi:hypothetical protein